MDQRMWPERDPAINQQLQDVVKDETLTVVHEAFYQWLDKRKDRGTSELQSLREVSAATTDYMLSLSHSDSGCSRAPSLRPSSTRNDGDSSLPTPVYQALFSSPTLPVPSLPATRLPPGGTAPFPRDLQAVNVFGQSGLSMGPLYLQPAPGYLDTSSYILHGDQSSDVSSSYVASFRPLAVPFDIEEVSSPDCIIDNTYLFNGIMHGTPDRYTSPFAVQTSGIDMNEAPDQVESAESEDIHPMSDEQRLIACLREAASLASSVQPSPEEAHLIRQFTSSVAAALQ
ncbi:hypothetical protein BD626DRAFT_477135 [Schizophyllum amplum]|uniref:Uncharacterized protein n=1 Tax=Schizophyllum amplum TaxID=97359 RepID=A0A550CZY3_9AGAR|nr:hypothetical protein BD626DRAFT_477135 [Auriculariopsis ampla]